MADQRRWIIAGSRYFSDKDYAFSALDNYASSHGYPDEVVSGTASGADTLGELWANLHNIPIRRFPPDWKTYGRRAGPIRNGRMAEYAGENGTLFLFWDGNSAGSRSMFKEAEKRGVPVVQFIVSAEQNL